jgi:hypothetical protein
MSSRFLLIAREVGIIAGGAALVFACIHFGPRAINRFRFPPAIQMGSYVRISTDRSLMGTRAVFVFASNSCPLSMKSIEFHEQLIEKAREVGTAVRFVVPSEASAQWYATRLAIPHSQIVVDDLGSLGIRGTPTILLRNAAGRVEGLWEGFLPPNEQRAVVARLSGHLHSLESPPLDSLAIRPAPDETAPELPIEQQNAPELLSDFQVQNLDITHTVIDVRERKDYEPGPIKNELNIPFRELSVRARIELNPGLPTTIDCSSTDVDVCDLATAELLTMKFSNVSVLDRGSRGATCRITSIR